MTKRKEVKYKVCTQNQESIWAKPLEHKLRSFKNKKKTRNTQQSEYAIKLRAKQKLKHYYGELTEKQFYNTYKRALNSKGKTGDNLLNLLEKRLDNVVYRMNLTNSIFHSRQLVNHNFIMVNGRVINIPSYEVQVGDLIQIKPNKIDYINTLITNNVLNNTINVNHPNYLEVDYKVMSGIFLYEPSLKEIPYVSDMSPKHVIEFYSR